MPLCDKCVKDADVTPPISEARWMGEGSTCSRCGTSKKGSE